MIPLRPLVLFSTLFLGSCAIFRAPIALPIAIASNVFLHLQGQVTGPDGHPLSDVSAKIEKTHTIISALNGATTGVDSSEDVHLKDGRFDILRRHTKMVITFDSPGYFARSFTLNAHGLCERVFYDAESYTYGDFSRSNVVPFPVPLDKIEQHNKLKKQEFWPKLSINGWREFIDLDDSGMYDDPHGNFHNGGSTVYGNHDTATTILTPHAIYLDADRDASGNFLIDHMPPRPNSDLLFCPHWVPHELRIVSQADGGFIRIPMRSGDYNDGRPRVAPPDGYQKTLLLTSADISASSDNQGFVPFYIKNGTTYGRGVATCNDFIQDIPQHKSMDHHFEKLEAYLVIWWQPDGSRNVE